MCNSIKNVSYIHSADSRKFLAQQSFSTFSENVFLIKKAGLKPASVERTKCAYPDRATSLVFFGNQDAATACFMHGKMVLRVLAKHDEVLWRLFANAEIETELLKVY